jgi:membrane protein
VLYRYGPDRNQPKWRWVSPGALFATSTWLVASVLFSVYTANFGKYNETYGSLGAVVVVMLWLFLTVAAVLVGAELNAELERQTLQDPTRGPDQPIGQRHANAADTVGATAEQLRQRTRARK